MLRYQLPVYSPLTLRALASATASVLRGDNGVSEGKVQLEQLLKESFSAHSVVLVGSGTEALTLAIEAALAATRSRRVALPGFSCYDVASAAVAADARIALYDLDPATLGPDLTTLEKELVAGTRVVVASPLYGVPLDWQALSRLCESHGAILVEDAAQGHGASWGGRPVGSLGEISTISFGRGKGWSGGGGGAVLLRGSRIWNMRPPERRPSGSVAQLGKLGAQWALGRPSTYMLPASIPWLALGETVYHDAPAPAALCPVAAATILRIRDAAHREAQERRTRAVRFGQALAGSRAIPIDLPRGSVAGFLRFPVRRSGGHPGLRDSANARRLGVMPTYPSPLGALAQVRARLESVTNRWPGAQELVATLITLPTHSRVTERDSEEIVSLLI